MQPGASSKQPETTITIGDLISLIGRRLPLILAVAAVVMTGSGIVIYTLPDTFDARAVVYVEVARVPETYKKTGYIVPRLSQIIGILRQETLSRDTLRDLVNELDLYDQKSKKSSGPATFDPIELARKDIKIDIVKRFNDDYVEISARARTAALAAKAVNRVSDVLSAKNQALRLKQEQDAKAFVESQLVGAQRRLQEADAAQARFREANQESLPENNSTLLDRISKLRFDKGIAQDRLQKSQLTVLDLQRRIEAIRSGTPGAAPGAPVSADRRALEVQLARLLDEEAALLSRGYGDGMPAVARVRSAIKRTREQLAALDAGPGAPETHAGAPDPAAVAAATAGAASVAEDERVRPLMGQIAEMSGVITAIERELEHNAAETARLEMLKASTVQTRAHLEKVQDAYEEASAEYKVLASDLRDIEKIIAADEAGRSDQFRTIEAAEAPLFPASPNRPLLLGGALAAALGLGFGLAYLLELARPAYREAQDVEADLHLDVLASLPEIPDDAGDPAAGRRRAPAGAAP